MKGNLSIDPRGLIFESYRIKGIRVEECRSIFLDWALGSTGQTGDENGRTINDNLRQFMTTYGDDNPDHPMTRVLQEGLEKSAEPQGRRGGSKARH